MKIAWRVADPDPSETYFHPAEWAIVGGIKVVLTHTEEPMPTLAVTDLAVTGIRQLDVDGPAIVRPRSQAGLEVVQ